jgi:lipopolysaccharide biosynthesis regulator YciM
MGRIVVVLLMTVVLGLAANHARAEGAGEEWEKLIQEASELGRSGQGQRAITVAQAALELADQQVGPEHPDVAGCLENLAALYRKTDRPAEADQLEARAKTIRAIKR